MTSLPPHLEEHYEDPYNYGPLDGSTHQAELNNTDCPLQLDVCVIQAILSGPKVELWFDGDACPWCQSAASLILERLADYSAEDIQEMAADLPAFWRATADPGSSLADVATPFRDVPAEHRGCVELVWRAIDAALESGGDEGPTFSGPHLGEES